MNGLALQVQQTLECDPNPGDIFAFRGRRADLQDIPDDVAEPRVALIAERGRRMVAEADAAAAKAKEPTDEAQIAHPAARLGSASQDRRAIRH
jgi:hypothetical protein